MDLLCLTVDDMEYNELLLQKEWSHKCNDILSRDKFTCQNCGCIGFHNGDSYLCLDSIEDAYPLLNDFTIDGKSFPDFLKSMGDFEYENIEDINFYEDDISNDKDDVRHAFLYIYSKDSKYFSNTLIKHHKIAFNYPYKHEPGSAILLKNIITIDRVQIDRSYTYIVNCNKQVTKYVYVIISGSNNYLDSHYLSSNYSFSIIWGHQILILSFTTNDILYKGLNIHHKYYIKGRKPWEYDNDALVTLCEKCHKEIHEKEKIPVKDENYSLLYYPPICERCGGSGYLQQYYYYKEGVCFLCGGEGVIM